MTQFILSLFNYNEIRALDIMTQGASLNFVGGVKTNGKAIISVFKQLNLEASIMNNDSIIFIGLDTHESFIQVAVLQEQRGATPRHLGRMEIQPSRLTLTHTTTAI